MTNHKEYFVAVQISRQDFSMLGYDAGKLTNKQMQNIADQLGADLWGDEATTLLVGYAQEIGLETIDPDMDYVCPRCIEPYEDESKPSSGGGLVQGEAVPSDCTECGVCATCEHMSECSEAKDDCEHDVPYYKYGQGCNKCHALPTP